MEGGKSISNTESERIEINRDSHSNVHVLHQQVKGDEFKTTRQENRTNQLMPVEGMFMRETTEEQKRLKMDVLEQYFNKHALQNYDQIYVENMRSVKDLRNPYYLIPYEKRKSIIAHMEKDITLRKNQNLHSRFSSLDTQLLQSKQYFCCDDWIIVHIDKIFDFRGQQQILFNNQKQKFQPIPLPYRLSVLYFCDLAKNHQYSQAFDQFLRLTPSHRLFITSFLQNKDKYDPIKGFYIYHQKMMELPNETLEQYKQESIHRIKEIHGEKYYLYVTGQLEYQNYVEAFYHLWRLGGEQIITNLEKLTDFTLKSIQQHMQVEVELKQQAFSPLPERWNECLSFVRTVIQKRKQSLPFKSCSQKSPSSAFSFLKQNPSKKIN